MHLKPCSSDYVPKSLFREIEYVESLPSTNDYLKQFAENDLPRAVMAGEQTAGKGQFGRSWISPPGVGLYVSYLIYPGWPGSRVSFLNSIAALAVVDTVKSLSRKPLRLQIKLPNDILIGERKVCGILTELSTLADRIRWAIVGIGINLFQHEFPRELRTQATSFALEGISGVTARECCVRLTQNFEEYHHRLQAGEWEQVAEEFSRYVI
ncbi:MAG: biotin--[acetyl-CoA-carboxylase] ligase [Acidobacteria bacterium]|nr:biotin--[acetyl-CoA-carboxylase] ligase [Acidobacteriota bacterium]